MHKLSMLNFEIGMYKMFMTVIENYYYYYYSDNPEKPESPGNHWKENESQLAKPPRRKSQPANPVAPVLPNHEVRNCELEPFAF